MSRVLRFPSAVERDPAIEVWMRQHADELGSIARHWFEIMRGCGDNVRELLHDERRAARDRRAGGEPPEIVALEKWRQGWEPRVA